MGRNKNRIEDIERFIKLFPTTSSKELEKIFGVSRSLVTREAKEHGCKKDKDYLSKIQRERAVARIVPNETREKIALKAKGRKVSPETTAKILATKIRTGAIKTGADHPFWKGGKPWERFKNPLYQDWRNAVLKRDLYTCQQCGCVKKKYDRGLTAHHIKPYAQYLQLRYEVSNGITLCRECHMTIHGKIIKPVPLIPCACGCGTLINSTDPYHNRPRSYVNGHSNRGKPKSVESIQKMRDAKQGKVLTPEHRAKIAAGFRKGDPSSYNYPSMKEQGRHRKNNHMVEFRGETKCIAEWSEITGIRHSTLSTRLRNGWDIEDAFTTPPSRKNSKRRGK